MKTLIFEDEFMTDLFINQNNGCNVTDDLFDFLSNDFYNYKLICNFKSIEEYKKASVENPLLELLMDKFDKIIFEPEISDKVGEDDFYLTIENQNIFLLTSDVGKCKKMTEKTGFLYLNTKNIKENWKIFQECKNGLKLKVTESDLIPTELKLDCWSKFKRFNHPLTSIVIFDKYILKDNDLQPIKSNLCLLIENLVANGDYKGEIELTIITEIESNKMKIRYDFLNEWLTSRGIKNIRINIIRFIKTLYPKDQDQLHGRTILTNYFHISSNDSFNLFTFKGKVVNDADLTFTFCLRKNQFFFFSKELNDLKRYVEKLQNDASNIVSDYRELYYPSKTNKLLN